MLAVFTFSFMWYQVNWDARHQTNEKQLTKIHEDVVTRCDFYIKILHD